MSFYFPFFATTLVFAAPPFGTFLNRRFTEPHVGHDQLSGNSDHAFGPFVKT